MPNDPQLDALKVPPHSIEAEQSVLGGLLLENAAIDRIADVISESDFYNDAHRLIYHHINMLGSHGRPADVITLSESLGSVQKLDYVGGMSYVGALAQNVPSAANIRTYAQIVRERAVLRRLAAVGAEISDSAFTPMGRSAGQLLDEAEKKVFDIAEQGARGQVGFQEIRPLLTKVVERIEELYNRDNASDVTGIATGYNDLDSKTSGFQPGDLIIVAGRPSMGKTALALNIAENVALNVGRPVAVFSMEMGATQLAMRLIGSVGKLDQHKIRTGRLHNDDWERLSSALGRLNDAPIHIDETPALNSLELRARARRLHRTAGGLGLIVVDYLQLMQAVTQGENRATEISEVSRSLKALAKELQVPVVALSQLNRGLEQRPNKRPVMSDLRECVTGDTLVLTTNGARTPIRELVGTTPEVWAIDADQKIVAARADLVWSKGVKPVFRVSLASGRSIRATGRHRLFGASGWQRVSDLEPGSRLALARHIPLVTPSAKVREPELLLETVDGQFGINSSSQNCAYALSHSELPDAQEVNRWAHSDLYWDRVVEIRPDGEEEVFDLTVPGPSTWLADGIVSHNSGAIEQDADLILFIYRDEVYNPESTDKGTAEIIIAKQRNGPIGMVRLTFLGEYTRFENHAQSF